MLNFKLETLNTKQTRISKSKNSKQVPFEFYILDLFRIQSLLFRV